MFERFTQEAREVVVTAQEEARSLQAEEVGPVHLLLGVAAGVGCAACMLPVRWRRAGERAAEDALAARLDDELAELLAATDG